MRRFLAILLCAAMLAVPVRAAEETKYAVLTFDDGPSGRFTRRLLDCLKERDGKATFLLCGYRISKEGAARLAATETLTDTASCVLNVFRAC